MNTVMDYVTFHLHRCVGNCNNLNYFSDRVCVQNKIEDLHPHVINMITWINESKTLTKRILCECKCNFNGRKCNLNKK